MGKLIDGKKLKEHLNEFCALYKKNEVLSKEFIIDLIDSGCFDVPEPDLTPRFFERIKLLQLWVDGECNYCESKIVDLETKNLLPPEIEYYRGKLDGISHINGELQVILNSVAEADKATKEGK